jgi:hypothetical protein
MENIDLAGERDLSLCNSVDVGITEYFYTLVLQKTNYLD